MAYSRVSGGGRVTVRQRSTKTGVEGVFLEKVIIA